MNNEHKRYTVTIDELARMIQHCFVARSEHDEDIQALWTALGKKQDCARNVSLPNNHDHKRNTQSNNGTSNQGL